LITRIVVVLTVVITVLMTTTIVTVAGPSYRELLRIPLLGISVNKCEGVS
jgi:hypothetical protein